jgi:hypothetical protein
MLLPERVVLRTPMPKTLERKNAIKLTLRLISVLMVEFAWATRLFVPDVHSRTRTCCLVWPCCTLPTRQLDFVESLLRLEAKGSHARLLADIAGKLLEEVRVRRRSDIFAAPASLLVLRFGDNKHLRILRRCFQETSKGIPPRAIRATAIVYASYGREEFHRVRRTAAVHLTNPFGLLVRLVLRISKFTQVPDRYKARLIFRRDSVSGRDYLDMRVLLAARLLSLNKRKSVRLWLKTWTGGMKKRNLSAFDKQLLTRLLP